MKNTLFHWIKVPQVVDRFYSIEIKILHTVKEFSQIMPENGWVEHDPIEILETQLLP